MKLLRLAALAAALFAAAPASAQNEFKTPTAGKNVVGVQLMCQNGSNQAVPCSGVAPLPISGSLTGFLPSAAGARGTPLTVTTSDSSGTLPTGAVVDVSNVGSNPMYCNVNGVAATVADKLIAPQSWFEFTIPSGVTTLHCIATGGSTTANMVGGSGLGTGAGGGSSAGGGGGTSSSFGSAFPATGTAAGFSDGTNMAAARVTSAALADTFTPPTAGLVQGQSFPMVYNGTTFDRLRGDSTNGAWVNVKTSVLPTGAATSANQATANSALGTPTDSPCSLPTSTASCSMLAVIKAQANSSLNPLPAQVSDTWIGNVKLQQGASLLSISNPIFSRLTDGTNGSTVKAASTPAAATDTALVVDQRPGTMVSGFPGTLALGAPFVKGTTAAMTGTTSTQVVAAVASNRLYITRVACKGDPSNGVGTKVQIQDGSGGTVLDTLSVSANGGGEQGTGSTPLFWTTSGNGLYAQNVTTGASVICTASGYSG